MTLSGGVITVTENMLGNGSYHLYGSAANSAVFGFNTAAGVTGVTISSITGSGGGTWSSASSTAASSFGTFSFVITNSNTGDLGTTLSFEVSDTGGFTSVTQLFNQDAAGYAFATQLGTFNSALDVFFDVGFGGGTKQSSVVPEPASIALLGSGLCVLGGWIRKRQSKR
jgi:hypothetical protein